MDRRTFLAGTGAELLAAPLDHIVSPADLRDVADKLADSATGKGTGKVKGRVAKPAP